MNLDEKLHFFRELLKCNESVYLWCYDDNYQLLYSDCPKEELFHAVFSEFGCMDAMYEYGREHSAPMSIGISLGLLWTAIFEKENEKLKRVHVIGPVFITQITLDVFVKSLEESNINMSIARKAELSREILHVPVVAQVLFTQKVLMLHYCVTGEYLNPHDVFSYSDMSVSIQESGERSEGDAYKAWNTEKTLMRLIREGDLNYVKIWNKATYLENVLLNNIGDPLRYAKNYGIIFTTVCSRAAIEGGLSPYQAFSAERMYIQSIEESKTTPEVSVFIYSMYQFYVESVHQCRVNPDISGAIRKCCDYIERNVEKKLRMADLARQIGYSESHLSRRFNQEMHCTLSEYINHVKMERAKLLLSSSDKSIQNISERLGFCSCSYFSEIFRKTVGCTPTEYRNKES